MLPETLERIERRIAEEPDAEVRRGLAQVAENLTRGWSVRGPFEPRASMQSWRETLYATTADATAVTAAAETALVPDFTIPANYMYPGRCLKYTMLGKMSSPITTPGTFTHRLRWGGAAGISLVASGAYAPDPTAASTNIAIQVEYWVMCRAIGSGTSGSLLAFGRMDLGDYDDATVTTLQGNLNMKVFADAPAAVGVDTTTAKALTPTVQPSLTTSSTTIMLAALEALT